MQQAKPINSCPQSESKSELGCHYIYTCKLKTTLCWHSNNNNKSNTTENCIYCSSEFAEFLEIETREPLPGQFNCLLIMTAPPRILNPAKSLERSPEIGRIQNG